jgi:hypothetical protein
METAIMNRPVNVKNPTTKNKVLMFDGYSAIQSCSYEQWQEGSMFLEENMLLVILQGRLKIRYGKAEYEVNKNQMAFLKKDIWSIFNL